MITQSRNQKKRSGNPNKRNKTKSIENQLLKCIPSYPNQHTWSTWIEATPALVSTTVTTGVIASTYDVQASNIGSFATRFGATFVEFRIVKARFRARCFSSNNPGLLVAWFDEKSVNAPTLAEAQQRMVSAFSAADIIGNHMIAWRATDLLDLEYVDITSVMTPLVTYKIFSNAANFGSSIVATPYLEIVPEFLIQFRGLQGV